MDRNRQRIGVFGPIARGGHRRCLSRTAHDAAQLPSCRGRAELECDSSVSPTSASKRHAAAYVSAGAAARPLTVTASAEKHGRRQAPFLSCPSLATTRTKVAQPLRAWEQESYCQKEKLVSSPQILRKRHQDDVVQPSPPSSSTGQVVPISYTPCLERQLSGPVRGYSGGPLSRCGVSHRRPPLRQSLPSPGQLGPAPPAIPPCEPSVAPARSYESPEHRCAGPCLACRPGSAPLR